VVERVDLAFQHFFRREKMENAGFPRFKGKNRYDSFTYPKQSGFELRGDVLHLSKIGDIPIKIHRELIGKGKPSPSGEPVPESGMHRSP